MAEWVLSCRAVLPVLLGVNQLTQPSSQGREREAGSSARCDGDGDADGARVGGLGQWLACAWWLQPQPDRYRERDG